MTAPGWKLRFTAKRNVSCQSGSFTEPSGTFSDGSEEEDYASDANCRWVIAPENASWVRLSFNEFDISDEDIVNVYKGTSTSNLTLVGTYSNATPPPSSITNSTGGVMKVDFKSDCYLQNAGFSAEWTSGTTAIQDQNGLDFETFPNPANTYVSIIVPKDFRGGEVRITDMTGRTVLTQELGSNGEITTLSTENLTSGIYLITLSNQKVISSKKLIIKR